MDHSDLSTDRKILLQLVTTGNVAEIESSYTTSKIGKYSAVTRRSCANSSSFIVVVNPTSSKYF